MADRTLTLRELNRTTLSRQLLLERASMKVPAAVSHLVGLQAQNPLPPYVGLWTRLQDFQRDDLSTSIDRKTIIKATLMRATLHLYTAEDYLRLRGTLQAALNYAYEGIAKRRENVADLDTVLAMAHDYFAESPRTFAEVTAYFSEQMPDYDIGAIRYGIRTHLPLIQVPTDTEWRYPGNPQFALADAWLDQPIPMEYDLKTLVWRYLAAFGPATVKDIEKWSGIPKLKDAVSNVKSDLQIYRDEKKRELFDLPELPILDGDTPAPVRFIPEFDNLLLAHDNRTRIVADEYRKRVYLPGLRVAATFQVDGFVRGAWKVETSKKAAVLTLEPFDKLTKQDTSALTEEGEKLARFIAPSAQSYEVTFAE